MRGLDPRIHVLNDIGTIRKPWTSTEIGPAEQFLAAVVVKPLPIKIFHLEPPQLPIAHPLNHHPNILCKIPRARQILQKIFVESITETASFANTQ